MREKQRRLGELELEELRCATRVAQQIDPRVDEPLERRRTQDALGGRELIGARCA